jgi:phosphoglycolate phosphatase
LRDTFREAFGFEGEQVELAVERYREYFGEKGLLENELYPGIIFMLETLKRLSVSGLKIAMATSKVTEYAEIIAKYFDFYKYFDFIGGSEFDGTRSTKPEVIAHVLKQFDTAKNRTVIIGDRKHDIVGAKEAGISSIGVLWGFGGEKELTKAGANFIANSPEDVIKLVLGE